MSVSLSETGKHLGSIRMLTAPTKSLLRTDSSALVRLTELDLQVNRAGLHGAIAQKLSWARHNSHSLANLAERVASIADHAYATRQLEVVGQAGQLLSGLPLSRQVKSAGDYYQALALNQGGRGDTTRAALFFERVADDASLHYRTRAVLALGTNALMNGDALTAVSLYREVNRILTAGHSFDPVTLCVATRMNAVIRGFEGDHHGAVADLERMFPLARMASTIQPQAYWDYMNTLAVELGEVGRLEQARRASEIALSSPFAPAFPEWRETFIEIEAKRRLGSRSVVAVPPRISETREVRRDLSPTQSETHGLIFFPSPARDNIAALGQRSQGALARVLNFQNWKSMLSEPGHSGAEFAPGRQKTMTTGKKLIRLMDLISRDDTDDETIGKILDAVEKIIPRRKSENRD